MAAIQLGPSQNERTASATPTTAAATGPARQTGGSHIPLEQSAASERRTDEHFAPARPLRLCSPKNREPCLLTTRIVGDSALTRSTID